MTEDIKTTTKKATMKITNLIKHHLDLSMCHLGYLRMYKKQMENQTTNAICSNIFSDNIIFSTSDKYKTPTNTTHKPFSFKYLNLMQPYYIM